ncbi:MAG: right-handed parallel beta-helix repeat-containing protein [Chakrabartia sp.]
MRSPDLAMKENAMATYTVSNQVQLDAAITKVKGGDIVVLAAGNYSSLSVLNKQLTSTVTFQSQSATNPATVSYLRSVGSSNLVFQNLKVGRAVDPAVDKDWTNMALVENSSNVTLDGIKFFTSGAEDKYLGRGLFARGSSNVTVKNSDFSHLAVGMQVMSVSNANILSNKYHNLRIDGLEMTAVTGGKVDGNDFRDFKSDVAYHPDAIQIWTAGTAKPTTDLVISNNVIMPGTGVGSQGIFIQDEVGGVPHERITIRNNLLLDAGNYYNGIAVRGGKDIVIENNTSVSPTGDTKNFWIRLDNVQGATVTGNVADQMIQSNSTGLSLSGNVFLNEQKSFATKIAGINLGSSATISSLIVSGVGYQLPGTSSTTTLATTSLAPTTTTTSTTTSLAAPTLSDTLTPISSGTTTTSTTAVAPLAKPLPSASVALQIAAPTSPTTLLAAVRRHRSSLSLVG